jgi:hypothetical protein
MRLNLYYLAFLCNPFVLDFTPSYLYSFVLVRTCTCSYSVVPDFTRSYLYLFVLVRARFYSFVLVRTRSREVLHFSSSFCRHSSILLHFVCLDSSVLICLLSLGPNSTTTRGHGSIISVIGCENDRDFSILSGKRLRIGEVGSTWNLSV